MIITKEESKFLEESNAIEREYSPQALRDAEQAWMMAKICMDEPTSIDYILAIHRRLMKRLNPEIAGNIRDCRVKIGGKIKWNDKEEIKEELRLLCKIIPKYEEEIKQWHIQFENIHPFIDGNGRVGRILMNIQRLKIGLPILIIHEGKEQMEYYKWFKDIN